MDFVSLTGDVPCNGAGEMSSQKRPPAGGAAPAALNVASSQALSYILPLSAVVATVVFSEWTFTLGAEFRSTAVAVTFLGFSCAQQLSLRSWTLVAISALVIFAHHAVLILVSLTRVQGGRPSHLEGLSSYRVAGSIAIEATFLLLVVLRCSVISVVTARVEERDAREDFILGARTRHRRNVSQRVVESMVPGPVASEMRSRMAQGLPPSLSWKFESVCILQSDIVGFTRHDRGR